MNTKTILTLIFMATVIFLIITYLKCDRGHEGFQDNLYGQGKTSCHEMCVESHPEAARMNLDEDNDIADQVMGECMKQCEESRGLPSSQGCSSCG